MSDGRIPGAVPLDQFLPCSYLVSHCVHLASFECTQYTSAFTLRHSSHHTPPSISFSSSSPSRSLFVFVFLCLLLFPHCVRVYLHSVSSSSFFLSFFVSPAYTCCMVVLPLSLFSSLLFSSLRFSSCRSLSLGVWLRYKATPRFSRARSGKP